MALNSFADVQAFITQILSANKETVGPPHQDFWNNLTYEQFTNKDNQPGQGNVPGVDPPVQILVVGDSKNSNIIQALKGVGLFDPNTGQYPQMPAFGPTYFTADQIAEIAAWIDNGCPE